MVILGLLYVGLGYYYRNSFSVGTRINGVYCTGCSVDEVNKMLTDNYDYPGVYVCLDNSNIKFLIPSDEIDFEYSFDESLSEFLNNQNEWEWPLNLFRKDTQVLIPRVSIDEDKLDGVFNSHDILCEQEAPTVTLSVENGVYVLKDNVMHRPNVELIRGGITQAIYASQSEYIIDDSCYYDEKYTAKQLDDINKYKLIKDMFVPEITYVFGDDYEEIDERVLTSFLICQEDEEQGLIYAWDDEKIISWVDDLADKYDTLGKTREFHTTDGRDIIVEGGIYGNQIDREAEKKYLVEAIHNGVKENREPEYKQKAMYQGLDDIGDTYVEVDMTGQKLYYYQNGELIIDSPVVTGNMMRHMDTPSGTNYVYFKQRNRTLHGANYETFVNYWIAVVGHIGIHDATWRKEFGGDIYMTDGSHGCINTPMDNVSKLYDLIELGTPVVMYYNE